MTKIFTKEENQAWAKNLPGKMCSACLIIRSEGKVLMVKASYKDHWTFPSGIVDENESPKSAALREAEEETGFSAKAQDCSFFTTIYTSSKDGDRDRFNFAFLTDIDSQDVELAVPNDEIAEAVWVAVDKVAEMSGNKGSYVQFQKLLTGELHPTPYIEV